MFKSNFERLVLRALAMLLRMTLVNHPTGNQVEKLASEIESYYAG
jgi:hypothetical protein